MRTYGYLRHTSLLAGLLSCSLPLYASSEESTFDHVVEIEKRLQAIEQEKREKHLTIADFYQHLHESLSEENQFLKDWYEVNTRYHQIYDEHIIHKQAYIIESVNKVVKNLYYSMSKDQQREHRYVFAKMQEEYHLWKDHKTMVGDFAVKASSEFAAQGKSESPQQLQQKRKYAFDKYFVLAKEFQHKTKNRALQKVAEMPVRGAKLFGLALSSPFAFAAYWLAKPFYDAPLYSLGMKIARTIGKNSDRFKNLTVEGKEHLKVLKKTPKNTVNLILPSHRNDTGDVFMLASMKVTPAMLFLNGKIVAASVDKAVADPLGNVIASLPEFVSVGSCKGISGQTPSEKMIKTLRKGSIKNVINYGQGFVANIHEVISLSPAFVPKLLGPLFDAGYKVRVVPVSYEIESSFLWSSEVKTSKDPLVRVAKPLDVEVVEQIYRMQTKADSSMPFLFETFMRANWIESIVAFPELKFEEIQERIRTSLLLEGFSLLPSAEREPSTDKPTSTIENIASSQELVAA